MTGIRVPLYLVGLNAAQPASEANVAHSVGILRCTHYMNLLQEEGYNSPCHGAPSKLSYENSPNASSHSAYLLNATNNQQLLLVTFNKQKNVKIFIISKLMMIIVNVDFRHSWQVLLSAN